MSENVYVKRGVKFSMIAEKHGSEDPRVDISVIDPVTDVETVLGEDLVISSSDRDNPTEITVYPIVRGGNVNINVYFKNDFYDESGDRNIRIINMELEHDLDTAPTTYLPFIWSEIEYDGLTISPKPEYADGFNDILLTHTANCFISTYFIPMAKPSVDGDQIVIENVKDIPLGFTISTNKDDNRLMVHGVESEDYTIVDANNIIFTADIPPSGPLVVEFSAKRNFIG